MTSFKSKGNAVKAVAVLAILTGVSLFLMPSDGTASDEPLLYGSTDMPYGGLVAQWDDLRDGAVYHVVKGGYIDIDFRHVGKPDGVETLMAGSGLTADYVSKRIVGDIQDTAVINMGNKSLAVIMVDAVGKDLPVFGQTEGIQPSIVGMNTIDSCSELLMSTEVPDEILEVTGLPDGLVISIREGNVLRLEGSANEEVVADVHVTYRDLDGTVHEESLMVSAQGMYSVQYDADGGIVDRDTDTVVYGGFVYLPEVEREGYTFNGWYSGDTFVGMAGDQIPVQSDTVLKADWTEGSDDGSDKGKTIGKVLIIVGIILTVIMFLVGHFLIGIPAAACIVIGLLLFFRVLRF